MSGDHFNRFLALLISNIILSISPGLLSKKTGFNLYLQYFDNVLNISKTDVPFSVPKLIGYGKDNSDAKIQPFTISVIYM